MAEKIEMATVSSRGQICIPNNMREEMGLKEGSKVLFLLTDDSIIMKKVNMQTWAEVTKPLKEAMAKTNLKESEVTDIVHRFREKQRAKK
ncbi:MAG: AbrB/MazE/SpoVT family DNA-binding domain-containing protein [Nanoarchaeota archaeon]